MRQLMEKREFLEQLRGAETMSDADAMATQLCRHALGHKAVIRLLPIVPDLRLESFWVDIHGKARKDDGIAPIFFEIGEATVRGIALWRSPQESCYNNQ